jgi:hypothetical protein
MRSRLWRAIASATATASLVLAAPASATVDFGEARRLGPPSTWSSGNALARTKAFLGAVWASDCPPPHGACATDDGPYMGVFYQRARLGGGRLRWSRPARVSQGKQHASRPAIAAAGDAVVVGWVTHASYRHDAPRKRRVLYVRRSVRQGARWSSAIRLSAGHGRVDFPQLAAAGGTFYAVWTNANTGQIRLARSMDRGASWRTSTIGTTTSGRSARAGYSGDPSIGASGSNVVVAWYADDSGRQVAKVSTSGGADLAGAAEMQLSGPSPRDGVHRPDVGGADGGGSHDVAVAYTTATGIAVRTYDGTSLGNERSIVDPWPQALHQVDYNGAYGPVVVPYGSGGIAVAFAGCRAVGSLPDDCRPSSDARIDLLYAESTDAGRTWPVLARVADAGRLYSINDAPSLVISDGRRFLSFDEYDPAYSAYDVRLRVGSGTP